MFASALRKGHLLGRTSIAGNFVAPSLLMGPSQVTLLGMAPSASFAKYQRNKPHLNVGTIGRYLASQGRPASERAPKR